jgi:hypothetical protein
MSVIDVVSGAKMVNRFAQNLYLELFTEMIHSNHFETELQFT